MCLEIILSLLQSAAVSIRPNDRISIPNSVLVTTPRPILWLTLPSVQWVPGSLTCGKKVPGVGTRPLVSLWYKGKEYVELYRLFHIYL